MNSKRKTLVRRWLAIRAASLNITSNELVWRLLEQAMYEADSQQVSADCQLDVR